MGEAWYTATNWHEPLPIDDALWADRDIKLSTLIVRYQKGGKVFDGSNPPAVDTSYVHDMWILSDMASSADRIKDFKRDYLFANEITVGEYVFLFSRFNDFHRIVDRASWTRNMVNGTDDSVDGGDNFNRYLAAARSIVPKHEALAFTTIFQRVEGDIWNDDFMEDMRVILSLGYTFDTIMPWVLLGHTMPVIRGYIENDVDIALARNLAGYEVA